MLIYNEYNKKIVKKVNLETYSGGTGRNCSLALLFQASDSTWSERGLFGGKLNAGVGGGTRTFKPHIVVRFFTSRLHLNLKQLTFGRAFFYC